MAKYVTPSKVSSYIINKLEKIRRNKGIGQDVISAALRIQRAHVSNLERGYANISLELVYLYAQAVGVEANTLFPTRQELDDFQVSGKVTIESIIEKSNLSDEEKCELKKAVKTKYAKNL